MSKPKYSWDTFKLHESQTKRHPVTPKDIIVPSFEENFKIYLRVKPIPQSKDRNESVFGQAATN